MPHPHIAMVADPDTKEIHGMWLSPEYEMYAQTKARLEMMIVSESMPVEIFAPINSGSYRVVPNTVNKRGGVYVMFGTAKAPGEGASTSRKPRDGEKRWWEFWK